HKGGLPAVVLHCGMHSFRSEGYPKSTPWFEFTGLVTTRHDMQAPIQVSYVDKESPITKGLEDWKTINEELYNNQTGKLAETARGGRPSAPLAQSVEQQTFNLRVPGSIPGGRTNLRRRGVANLPKTYHEPRLTGRGLHGSFPCHFPPSPSGTSV